MRYHVYIILSVLLWGTLQLLVDGLLVLFSPTLLMEIRFFLSGIILLALSYRQSRRPMKWRYLLTGGLGAFGYYILMAYALVLSSVPFVAIMGGVLPVLALVMDLLVYKRKVTRGNIFKTCLSLSGLFLFAFEANFEWNIFAAVLMVLANSAWLLYIYLKNKWHIEEEDKILGYEFLSAAILLIPFYSTFEMHGSLSCLFLIGIIVMVVFSTILPYQLYLRGSAGLSMTTASMYMNLLPIASLLPVIMMGNLSLSALQLLGIAILVISATKGDQ